MLISLQLRGDFSTRVEKSLYYGTFRFPSGRGLQLDGFLYILALVERVLISDEGLHGGLALRTAAPCQDHPTAVHFVRRPL